MQAACDVRGLRLCHLQCGSGEEALSWANAGDKVTGVDISPKQIDLAARKAEATGISPDFLGAEVSSGPASLDPESFDIVYTGGGALVWLPDLDSWAASIRELLTPSGRLILNEEHPQMGCIESSKARSRSPTTISIANRASQPADGDRITHCTQVFGAAFSSPPRIDLAAHTQGDHTLSGHHGREFMELRGW